jgi:hypothetical protein
MVIRGKLAVMGLGMLTVAFLGSAGPQQAQTRQYQAPGANGLAGAQAREEVFALLDQGIATAPLEGPLNLLDALKYIQESVARATGRELRVFIDAHAFMEVNADAPEILETRVTFPQLFHKSMTARDAIRICLDQICTRNAVFYVKNGTVWISAAESSTAEAKLVRRVATQYTGQALAAVCEDLSSRSGLSIIIDPIAAKQAETPIHTTFRGDITLGGALQALAESARLKAVLLDESVYLTVPARADRLRRELNLQRKGRDPLWPRLVPEHHEWIAAD